MDQKIKEIIKLEQEIQEHAMQFETEKDGVIARYRNQAHEEIAEIYRKIEQEHDANLEMTFERAQLKREVLDAEKAKQLEKLKIDFDKHFDSVKKDIIEEVFAYGRR